MAQIGNVHPDDLVPWWHHARHLTPQEIETVGRLVTANLDAYLADAEMNLTGWLDMLPPIPPRRADRASWWTQLEGRHGGDYQAVGTNRRHRWALQEAVRENDAKTLLLLLTRQRRPDERPEPEVIAQLRPAWKKELQAIRDAYDKRVDDALEQAVQAKAAELAQD